MFATALISFVLLLTEPSQLEIAKENAKGILIDSGYESVANLEEVDLQTCYLAFKTISLFRGFLDQIESDLIVTDEISKLVYEEIVNQIKNTYTKDEIEILFALSFDERIHSIYLKNTKLLENVAEKFLPNFSEEDQNTIEVR